MAHGKGLEYTMRLHEDTDAFSDLVANFELLSGADVLQVDLARRQLY